MDCNIICRSYVVSGSNPKWVGSKSEDTWRIGVILIAHRNFVLKVINFGVFHGAVFFNRKLHLQFFPTQLNIKWLPVNNK